MNETQKGGGTGRGCVIAIVVAIAAVFVLPILGMVLIRVFGHRVDSTPAQIQQRLNYGINDKEGKQVQSSSSSGHDNGGKP